MKPLKSQSSLLKELVQRKFRGIKGQHMPSKGGMTLRSKPSNVKPKMPTFRPKF